MVMHARKPQRITDGYFEKHQTHPYQNSNYNSSKPYASNSERYEKFRDSPNGNAYRSSDSPDAQSPPTRDRDKSYQSSSAKNSHLQKIREKERDTRDFKMSRDKYSDCTRSPKDKRNRESDHRATSERTEAEKNISHSLKLSQMSRDRKPAYNNCIDKVLKKDDRDRITKVGDWSEHVSSSGKKYYYNCKTEVSQWEKPREWIDRERDRYNRGGRDRERDDRYRDGSSRSNMRHDKHSNYRSSNNSGNNSNKDGGATATRHWNSNSISSRDNLEGPNSHRETSSDWGGSSSRRHSNPDNSVSLSNSSAQDMDISPGDSTPTSEMSYGAGGGGGGSGSAHQTPLIGEQMGPVLLANALPRLASHPSSNTSTSTSTINQQYQHNNISLNNTPLLLSPPGQGVSNILHSSGSGSNAPGPPGSGGGGGGSCGSGVSGSQSNDCKKDSSLTVDINQISGSSGGNCTGIDGPPTPTHSEVIEGPKAGSPQASGLPSGLQSVSSSLQALRPQGPTLTPSLANHYRDDLVNHVRGWPAEVLEKQAQKLSEDSHIMGSIHCAKVSAELKSARSIVRLTEIQAILQEQRILFLRQQIKELEELKSQNSFMSDDS